MFRKSPTIKNLSPLKSSERRKLADQIRKDYDLPEPQTETTQESDGQSQSQSQSQPQTQTLSSLRNALLPDPTLSAKFTTTHGPKSTPISGTVYVGAHPGEEERILWFQVGKDERLIPTVYTLWQNPGIIPLLHVGDIVVSKLKGGADLFAPGLIKPYRGFDVRAKMGSVVAVAGHKSDTVPRWVGISKVDATSLTEHPTGTAAEGLHWEGDELWSWSALNKGGASAPADVFAGWPGISSGIEEDAESLDLNDDEPEGENVGGGVALADGQPRVEDRPEGEEEQKEEEEHIPTTKEVDDAFMEAFLYAVYNAKKTTPTEPHGLVLPIQPSFLISNMIQPHLRNPSPHFNIKKTSWKNAKKFIKHLDKSLLVKSKDRNGGETIILDIDFKDERLKSFQPYRLPKPKVTESAEESGGAGLKEAPTSGTDTSLNQKLSLQILYRGSAKIVPDLLPNKTSFYTSSEVTAAIKAYIEDNPELVDPSKKRYIKLNPFLANNILGSNTSSDDTKALAAGEIDRAYLNRRILEDSHLCVPHWILLRNAQSIDDSGIKPKTGPSPHVTLTMERRAGNKVVTAVAGLENFYINPHVIRPELQKKCAGSASVGQLIGGKPGTLELTVQGDQRVVVIEDILAKRGVRSEWVDIVDKTKKKKK